MFIVPTLLVVLAQAPQVECESAYGVTRCARTLQGHCLAAYGQVVCGDPAPAAYQQGTPPRVECLAASGAIACGYHCEAAYGVVKCADTPEGRCVAASGALTCTQGLPLPSYGRHRKRRAPAPAPMCESAYGVTACGYGCVAAYGEVRCSSRPEGRCVAAYGHVTCSN